MRGGVSAGRGRWNNEYTNPEFVDNQGNELVQMDHHPDDLGVDLSGKDPSSRKRLTYEDSLVGFEKTTENNSDSLALLEHNVESKTMEECVPPGIVVTPGKVQVQKKTRRVVQEQNSMISAASSEEADRTQ